MFSCGGGELQTYTETSNTQNGDKMTGFFCECLMSQSYRLSDHIWAFRDYPVNLLTQDKPLEQTTMAATAMPSSGQRRQRWSCDTNVCDINVSKEHETDQIYPLTTVAFVSLH